MPAWMKKQQQAAAAAPQPAAVAPPRSSAPTGFPYNQRTPLAPPAAQPTGFYRGGFHGATPAPVPQQFADAPEPTNGHANANAKPVSGAKRSRSRERRDRRSRSRSSRRRDRDHSSSHRSSAHARSSRSRSRDRSSAHRSSAHRSSSSRRSASRSPEIRRRRRKNNFDVRPPGVTDENSAAYAAQAILQQNMAALQGAVGPASFGPPPTNGASFSVGHQQTRHARRLYVGGIGEVAEHEISVFFNDVIDRALGERQEGGAVVSVYINRERHFAFVELKSIELTTACMNLDGVSFRGQPLKIRRPNDYNPATIPQDLGPIPQLNLAALGIVSTTVQDSPNKIFVGGIPYHLNDDQVKELLQAFGPLKSFHLVKELNTNMSKGYGFCEYLDPSVTDQACLGLNDMKLGDKTLTVRRAMSSESAKAVASAAGSVNSALSMGLDATSAALQTISMAGFGLGVPLGVPSRVIILNNMVTPEELEDEEEYTDILDDIKSECERFGKVLSLVIPRPRDGVASAVGKVFVEFDSVPSAQAASTELHGRGFANRIVAVEFMDEQKYARRDFSD